MLRFWYFLSVWVVPVCTRAYEYEYSSADSRDLASATFHSVECDLSETLTGQVIYDELNDVFRKPAQAEETLGSNNTIPVKECLCVTSFGRTRQYCSANFNTCRVQGEGAVFCFTNETKLEVARGVWPFCLFWFAMLVYLWIASEPGRRARSYLRRHATNGVVHFKSVFLGDPTTTTTAAATSLDSPEVDATSAQQENGTQEGAPNTAAQDEEMDMQNRVDPTSTLPLTSGDNVSANDDDDEEEGPNTSQPDNADYAASRARAIAASSEPLPEFGSRSNYQQLLQELYHIHRYESERMLRLWHSAWYREQSQYENNPQQQQQQEGEHTPITSTATPWWNSRRTVKLALRTKRYEKNAQNGDEEANVGEEHQNDADSQQEGRGTNSCAICLVEIEEGDIVGDIPCHHVFHKECLKSWLQRSNRCPLCQQEGIASPRRPSLRLPEASSGAEGVDLESS